MTNSTFLSLVKRNKAAAALKVFKLEHKKPADKALRLQGLLAAVKYDATISVCSLLKFKDYTEKAIQELRVNAILRLLKRHCKYTEKRAIRLNPEKSTKIINMLCNADVKLSELDTMLTRAPKHLKLQMPLKEFAEYYNLINNKPNTECEVYSEILLG